MKSQDVVLYPHHFFSQQQINSFDWKLQVQLNFCQVCLFFPCSIAENFFPSISVTDELRNQDILKRIIPKLLSIDGLIFFSEVIFPSWSMDIPTSDLQLLEGIWLSLETGRS